MRTQFKPAESLEFLFVDEFMTKEDYNTNERKYDKRVAKAFDTYEDSIEDVHAQEDLERLLYGR